MRSVSPARRSRSAGSAVCLRRRYFSPHDSRGQTLLRGLLEASLDSGEDRLAVRVALLVVADDPQVGRREVVQLLGHLGGGEVVVAHDRERRAEAGGPARAVDLADHTLGRRGDRSLDVAQQLVGLAAAAADQLGEEVAGVVAGHPPAADRVVEHLLEALARYDDSVERGEHAADRLTHAVGRGLTRTLARRGGACGFARPRSARSGATAGGHWGPTSWGPAGDPTPPSRRAKRAARAAPSGRDGGSRPGPRCAGGRRRGRPR